MINHSHYSKDSFDFYSTVVESKRNSATNPNYKERLAQLSEPIRRLFETYDLAFQNSELESITAEGYGGQEKKDLLALYKYNNSVLSKLLIQLTTIGERKFDSCQMCTIEPVGSFDHYLPKENFPEYSVHPFNLFPACSKCNGKKGVFLVDQSGTRLFLNLYLDILPQVEFLQVDFEDDFPLPTFSLDTSELSPELGEILASHYAGLELFDRFTLSSGEVIDRLVSEAITYLEDMTFERFKIHVQRTENRMQSIYGLNYWKSVLTLSLIEHPGFMDYINDQE